MEILLYVGLVLLGFAAGTLGSLLGLGGGFLVVPALALLAGLPMHAAVGTSLLVIAMKCFAGLAGYITHVGVDSESAAIVGSLAIAGTFLGSRLSKLASPNQLRHGFGLFVLVIASILIVIEGSRMAALSYGFDRHLAGAILAGVETVVAAILVARRFAGASQAHPQV